MDTPGPTAAASVVRARGRYVAEVAAIWLLFALHALWRVPDVNEAHYLARAKHAWQPQWLARDFFLDFPPPPVWGAGDPHQVWYFLAGWPAQYLSLPALAWTLRGLTWALLALGLARLLRSLLACPAQRLLAAALFVALQERAHLAGEWIVGGAEAKGPAYALALCAVAAAVENRWRQAWLWVGGASALHALVGGWTGIALGLAWLGGGAQRAPLRPQLASVGLGLLLALPGLWPGLAGDWGVPREIQELARETYVRERLSHHLVLTAFPAWFLLRFGVLLGAWAALCACNAAGPARQTFRGFVGGALAIALLGVALTALTSGSPHWESSLLRFYFYRLTDVVVPLAVSVEGIAFVAANWQTRPNLARAGLGVAASLVLVHAGWLAIERTYNPWPRADKPGKVRNYEDWLDVCAAARRLSPDDALWLTPREQQTFKWHAQRAEVATWKDIPQQAARIVAWRQRIDRLFRRPPDDPLVLAGESPWYGSLAERPLAELRALSAEFDAPYLLTSAQPPVAAKLLYRNASYAIYDLRADE